VDGTLVEKAPVPKVNGRMNMLFLDGHVEVGPIDPHSLSQRDLLQP